jgi:hypothetical protein
LQIAIAKTPATVAPPALDSWPGVTANMISHDRYKETLFKGMPSAVDLFVLTNLDQQLLIMQTIIFFTKLVSYLIEEAN